jgi:hypothetical protein
VVPTDAGEPQVISFSLVLPIGWMNPPPLITAVTETVSDMANPVLKDSASSGSHSLDIVSKSLAAVPEFAHSSPSALPTLPLSSKVVMGRLRG